MDASEVIHAKGNLTVTVTNPDGSVKEVREVKNLVVTVGRTWIASRMAGAAAAVMSHMATGLSGAAAAAGDATLGSENARVALSSATASGPTVTYNASFPAGVATGSLQEAGLFNAASAGTLAARTVFPVVNKGSNDGMTISWNLNIA